MKDLLIIRKKTNLIFVLTFFIILIALFFYNAVAYAFVGEWHNHKDIVKDRLIVVGDVSEVVANDDLDQKQQKKYLIAVNFEVEDGWKIYNNQHSVDGLKIEFNIDNKEYYHINPVFPVAQKFLEFDKSYSYGYQGEFIVPIHINAESIHKKNTLNTFRLKLNYVACNNICVPFTNEYIVEVRSNQHDKQALAIIEQYQQENKQVLDDNKRENNLAGNNLARLFYMILIAFIGGVILNVMPCILPILSLKIISVINHVGEGKKEIRIGLLGSILGIVSSFIFIAIIIVFVKRLGHVVGWGGQFQNSNYLIFLIILLALFTSSLLGYMSIKLPLFLQKKLNIQNEYNVFLSNFMSGIVKVLLATSCTAPFVGSAALFAITGSVAHIFIIFIFMGLGLALPYILLILFPKVLIIIPKPGKWMVKVKEFLAYLLIISILWLIWVLSQQLNILTALFILAIILIFVNLLKYRNKLSILTSKVTLIILILLIIGVFSVPIVFSKYHMNQIKTIERIDKLWQKFSLSKIESYVEEEKVVFVDVTADWCMTCKYNKFFKLTNRRILSKFKQEKVILLKADFTKPNIEIRNYISSFDRSGIPLNVIYGPYAKEGYVLPILFSKKELLEAIDFAKYGSSSPKKLKKLEF